MRVNLLVLILAAICLAMPIENAAQLPFRSPDTYGNLCWEDESSRLRTFADNLLSDKLMFGYVLVYAGPQSCKDEAKYRGERARKYLIKQGVESKRIVVMDGGYRPELRTFLVVRPRNSPPFDLYPSDRTDPVSVRKRCVDKVFARVICTNPK
jgi:hypothetical protein